MTASPAGARPEPVRNAAAIASAATTLVGLLLTLLVVFHVLTPEGSAILGPALASAIPTVVGAVSTLVAAVHARGKVTPLTDPDLAALGLQLVEEGQAVAGAFRQAVRRPGPQQPGVADHAAPEDARSEAARQAALNQPDTPPPAPPAPPATG